MHPFAAVPVILYVVVVFGPTVMDELVDPVFHSNAVPEIVEDAFIVADAPLHISMSLAVSVSTGFGKTFTVTSPVLTHPSGLVTVTLYVVVAAGETVMEAVLAPVLQRNELPGMSLVAVSTEFSPTQILASEAATEMTGSGLTMISMLAVPVQPLADVPVIK